jgi:Lysozyme like domain
MTLNPLAALIACVTAIFGFTTLLEAPRGLSGQPSPTTTPVAWDEYPTTTVGQTTVTETSLPTTIANCDDAVNLARLVGWPEDQLDTLAVVMLRESNCVPTAHNVDDPHGGSYGLTQINGFWCIPNSNWPQGWLQVQGVGVTDCSELYIPEANLRAALAIYNNSGWGPWAATAP